MSDPMNDYDPIGRGPSPDEIIADLERQLAEAKDYGRLMNEGNQWLEMWHDQVARELKDDPRIQAIDEKVNKWFAMLAENKVNDGK